MATSREQADRLNRRARYLAKAYGYPLDEAAKVACEERTYIFPFRAHLSGEKIYRMTRSDGPTVRAIFGTSGFLGFGS